MHMSARLVRDPQALFVRVAGELDQATAPVLDQVLRTATRLLSAAAGRATGSNAADRGLWVDLSDLQSVDAAGLVPLRSAEQRLAADGGHLHLTGAPATVLRLLALPDPPAAARRSPGGTGSRCRAVVR
ncbi:STAS domain-containing protein [Modestobacter versicolor]|uniref:STAS domain-containing protein n=1 Tax=Modestobacter versicolor TaxID=429133 RepID=UPI0034DDEA8B